MWRAEKESERADRPYPTEFGYGYGVGLRGRDMAALPPSRPPDGAAGTTKRVVGLEDSRLPPDWNPDHMWLLEDAKDGPTLAPQLAKQLKPHQIVGVRFICQHLFKASGGGGGEGWGRLRWRPSSCMMAPAPFPCPCLRRGLCANMVVMSSCI